MSEVTYRGGGSSTAIFTPSARSRLLDGVCCSPFQLGVVALLWGCPAPLPCPSAVFVVHLFDPSCSLHLPCTHRRARLNRQALCALQGQEIREGAWSQKEPWLQGLSITYTHVCGSSTPPNQLAMQHTKRTCNTSIHKRCCWQPRLGHGAWLQQPAHCAYFCVAACMELVVWLKCLSWPARAWLGSALSPGALVAWCCNGSLPCSLC